MMHALGLSAAVVVSLAAAVYLFTRSLTRLRPIAKNKGKILLVAGTLSVLIAAVMRLPLLRDQQYSIVVSNLLRSDIHDVTVRIGKVETRFDGIKPGAVATRAGFSERPHEMIEMSWVDDEGRAHAEYTEVLGGVPRRYDSGRLNLAVFSEGKIVATFFLPNE